MHCDNRHNSPLVKSHKILQHTLFSSFQSATGVRKIRLQISMANVFRRIRKLRKATIIRYHRHVCLTV